MGLLLLGLSRERVQSIDGLLPVFQRYHHGGPPCSFHLRDEVGKLLLELLTVGALIRRGSAGRCGLLRRSEQLRQQEEQHCHSPQQNRQPGAVLLLHKVLQPQKELVFHGTASPPGLSQRTLSGSS